MENNNQQFEHIPAEKFAFVQRDTVIRDTKFQTKSRGYMADALIRFKKNKSSVVAAWIIGFLALYALLSPILSLYSIKDKDTRYQNYPPFIKAVADMKIGLWDGAKTLDSRTETQMLAFKAIAQETGMDPFLSADVTTKTEEVMKRGQLVTVTVTEYTNVKVNAFYQIGVVNENVSYTEFDNIKKFQDETGLQVLYPVVEKKDIYVKMSPSEAKNVADNPNIWYQCSDAKGTPILNDDGSFIPAYCTDPLSAADEEHASYREYNSRRIAGDDGSYMYSLAKSGSVAVRVCYFNYTQYLQWKASNGESFHEPLYIFGTNSMGQDMFCAIGIGARFSLIFAVLVSAINLTIGAIYGSIQGYYGGVIDLTLDRITDILSGVPFIVVTTLFQLHLAKKVGSVPSFLFAFVLTGWIGMAALTRKQFYRFKSQEHILAARTLGAGDWRLMFKHIFPNALGTIVTSCALVIPGVISSETSLTYLGIVNLSQFAGTSIGTLMQQGQLAMTSAPHAMIFPAMFFSLLMISFNLFGNGLRDAFNPTTRGAEG